MGLLDRFRRRRSSATGSGRDGSRRGGSGRAGDGVDEQHLRSFTESRDGVEAFVEPRTTVTAVTLLLVARDGEWTRRQVPDADWAFRWARKAGVPAYDAAVTGLPARMREYNRRQKEAEKRRLEEFLDGPPGSEGSTGPA